MDQKSHLQNYNISFHIAGTPYQQAATFSPTTSHHQSQCQQVPTTQQVMQQPMQYVSAHPINHQVQYQITQGRHPPPVAQQQQQQQQQIVAPQQQPSYGHMFHSQASEKGHHLHIVQQENEHSAPTKEKEIDDLRAAHLEEVYKLQERIKELEREKEEKEKLYERIQRRIRTDQHNVTSQQETAVMPESDDEVEADQTFCPSPAQSNSSVSCIKEEPIETSQEGELTTRETTITAKRELVGMEVSASETDGSQQNCTIQPTNQNCTIQPTNQNCTIQPTNQNCTIQPTNQNCTIQPTNKNCTIPPTNFTHCIICQKVTDEDLQNLTVEGVKNFRKIVSNKNDDIGKRLKNEVLDLKMFLTKSPRYHMTCRQNFKLENKRMESLKETDFSHCIICQEITGEKLFNVTERGYPAIQFAVSNKKDLTAKRLAIYAYSQDQFLSFLPKIHRTCRKYVNRQRVIKSMNRKESLMKNANKEEDEDVVDPETGRKLSGEEMLDLIKQHKNNEKVITNVTEICTIDFGTSCFICRKIRSKIGKEKYISIDNEKYENMKAKAKSLSDNTMLLILNSKNESERKLKFHKICYKTYLDKPNPKINLYNLPYDIAFTCLIKQIEEPLFKHGKAFDVSELRNEYRHYLSEQGIKSTIKAFKMSEKLKRYYTVPHKRCLVKIHTEVAQPSVVYSKHLSEDDVQIEIERLKMCRNSYIEADESENEAEENGTEIKSNQEALQKIIGENVIAAGNNSTFRIDKVFTKYKKIVKPKEPEQAYACSECDYRGNQERALILHMKKHQRQLENPKEVMCEECGKIFHSKEACNRHKLTHGSKNYLCSHCGKDFYDRYSLKKHILTHTAEKKYECTLCNMKFITKFYLKKHLLIHTDEKPLMCTICGYTCKQKDRLKDHMSKHSDERPYVCNICGKSFKFRQPLRTHMLLHGEKPCKCPECDFRCYTKGNLKAHMRKHTGEKVYKEKVYKVQVEKPVKHIKPINVNPEMRMEPSSNMDTNSCNTLYSYPVSTQDPRLYFSATRHFPHIPTYLFPNAQSSDSQ